MTCSTCGKNRINTDMRASVSHENAVNALSVVVEKSDNPTDKVKIRYYGAGSKVSTTGCKSCGGGKGYAMTTSETIMFVSEDAPNKLFKETFTIGHDYYVTEKQAEYLLQLTYRNKVGQIAHKFKTV